MTDETHNDLSFNLSKPCHLQFLPLPLYYMGIRNEWSISNLPLCTLPFILHIPCPKIEPLLSHLQAKQHQIRQSPLLATSPPLMSQLIASPLAASSPTANQATPCATSSPLLPRAKSSITLTNPFVTSVKLPFFIKDFGPYGRKVQAGRKI
jgi:hypothetical protein